MKLDIDHLLKESKLSLIQTKDDKWFLRLKTIMNGNQLEERFLLEDILNYRQLDSEEKIKYHDFVKHYLGLQLLRKLNEKG